LITIGIDPHKASVTAAALDPHDAVLAELRLPTTAETGTQLLALTAPWPVRRWAVEGATGLGHGVAQQLIAAGETVLDVPAKLSARARLLGTGGARKTDPADAASAAAVAIHNRQLRPVTCEDPSVVLRLLTCRRDDLVAERTRTLSRLHVGLRELHPGGAKRQLTAIHAAVLLRQIRPITMADAQCKRIARELLGDVRHLDRQVAAATTTVRKAVAASGTTLTQIYGIGPVLAAKILGHTGDIARFPDRDHYASYTGAAPIEASSDDLRRHRLNRAGNRQLNCPLHIIAVCQIRDPAPGRPTTSASSPRPRPLRRRAAASNATCPTSSTTIWSPTTAATHARIDAQRRYQVTRVRSVPLAATAAPSRQI
jgi:transposase